MNDNKPLAALAEELERIGNMAASAVGFGMSQVQTRMPTAHELAIAELSRAILLISQAMKDVE